jgi:predicted neutral ceramidase superfamily lipid hydrolase
MQFKYVFNIFLNVNVEKKLFLKLNSHRPIFLVYFIMLGLNSISKNGVVVIQIKVCMYIYTTFIIDFFNVSQALLKATIQIFHAIKVRLIKYQ